jgi:dihydrofolate synthase/folylpolyglutamate synthase
VETRFESVEQATSWLEGLINVERRPDWPYARMGLGPIRRLLARVGDPQHGLPVLHVAGSKGKGSTALAAEALLRAAGEKVGTFTSPHLERWTERFRVDGDEADGAALAAVLGRLRPHVEALREQDPADAPTFFDVTTAAALLLFREARVDRAVLEVGLGGRLDSTNVVDPAVCCITTIELEHTDRLGDSLAAIAGEKAGILKPGVPAVCGALPAEAAAVVAARARELGAPLARIGDEIELRVQSRGADGSTLELRDGDLTLTLDLPLLGEHQATNAALALACVRRLPGGPEGPALCEAAAKGLAALRLPGRLELVGRAPWVVIDAAHTPASAEALARALDALPRRRARLVLSVSAGKDLDAILAALLPRFDEVTVTRAEATRSLGAGDVARAVRAAAPGVSLRAVPNPFLAVRAAREGLGAGDLLCVAGSVYLAGIARRVLR